MAVTEAATAVAVAAAEAEAEAEAEAAAAVAVVGGSSSLSYTRPSRATGGPITLSWEAPSMTATTTSSAASPALGRRPAATQGEAVRVEAEVGLGNQGSRSQRHCPKMSFKLSVLETSLP